MKIPLLIVAVLVAGEFAGNCQITLHAGDTYTFQFDSLPFEGHATNGIAAPFGLFSVPIFPSSLGSNGMLRFEMFENSTLEAPILSRTLTASSPLGESSASVTGAWSDVQGAIRFTMISGSVSINVFSLEAVTPGSPSGFDVYGGRFVPVIPEPGVCALIALSGFVTVLARRSRIRVSS